MSEGQVFPVLPDWAARAHMNAAAYEAAWERVEADPASYWPQIVTFCTASNAQAVRRQGQAYNTLLISLPDVVSFLDQQLDDFETL